MNKKLKLLWCGESSHISSGFGNFTKEILYRLYDSNKYDIAELSCYRTNSIPKTQPWKIYPVAVSANDPLYNNYINNPMNQFGQWRFDIAAVHFKPDIVMDIRDFWNFSYQEVSCLRPFFKWIISPTYDSSPPKIETFTTFKNADIVLFHTEWAKKDLQKFNYNNEINIGDVINDSVDPTVFKPIGYSKKHHKQKFKLPTDHFVIGSVMRNQKRKLIPDIIESFKKINEKYPKTILYLHTTFPEKECWNIPSLLLEYNIAHSVYLTYRCRHCENFWPSIWLGEKTICPSCGNTAAICGLPNPISNQELNQIYNLFDLYVQYAICEGFGIPQIEAAACGVPVVTMDHGAMGCVGSKINADLIKVNHEFREMETEAFRAYGDNNSLISIIEKYINMDITNLIEIGKMTRNKLLENFSWDKTSNKIQSILDSVDISNNLDWSSPERIVNHEIKIPKIISNRDFIYYLIDNIIHDEFLKETNLVETIIKNLDNGIVFNNSSILHYKREQAVKDLEVYINNKVGIEKIRTNQADIPKALYNFISY